MLSAWTVPTLADDVEFALGQFIPGVLGWQWQDGHRDERCVPAASRFRWRDALHAVLSRLVLKSVGGTGATEAQNHVAVVFGEGFAVQAHENPVAQVNRA